MYSCQKILTNNAKKACLLSFFFLLFFKATSRKHFHQSGMRIEIKVYCSSSVSFPRQVRKFMAFKVLCPPLQTQNCPRALTAAGAVPLREAQLCWLQPAFPFPPLHHRVCPGTAWAFLIQPGVLLEWPQQNNGTRCGGQGPDCHPVSKGSKSTGTFLRAFSHHRHSPYEFDASALYPVLALPEPFFISILQHMCSEQRSDVEIFELALQIRITLTREDEIWQNCWCSNLSCLKQINI